METKRRYLKPKEAAEYIGSSSSTLAKLRLTNHGPQYAKIGGKSVVYDVADLDAYIASCKRRSTSELSPSISV